MAKAVSKLVEQRTENNQVQNIEEVVSRSVKAEVKEGLAEMRNAIDEMKNMLQSAFSR